MLQFITGYRLNKAQADIVLDLHSRLERLESDGAQRAAESPAATVSSTTTSANDYVASKLRADLLQVLHGGGSGVSESGDGEPRVINVRVEQTLAPEEASVSEPYDNSFLGLVRWVLADRRRYGRAVRLALALTMLVIVLGALLVFLVLQSPTSAFPIAVAVAALALVPAAAARRRATRVRRTREL